MIFVSVNGKWFFTYTEENDVYIEPGRNHANRSKITVRRRLDKKNFEKYWICISVMSPVSKYAM